MKDLFHRLVKWIDHNRWTFVAFALPIIFGICLAAGCLESKTTSIMDPGRMVGRPQFIVEAQIIKGNLQQERLSLENAMAQFNAKVELTDLQIEGGIEVLDEKDLRKAQIFETLGGLALGIAEGGVTPGAIITSMLSIGGLIYGIGKAADNKRKDLVIAEIKEKTV